MTLALAPFPVDLPVALSLVEDALRVRLAPGERLEDFLPRVSSAIRAGRATGGLLCSAGRAQGIVVWEPAGPLGVSVRLLYLTGESAVRERYEDALTLVERAGGPVAFAAGPLAGLSPEEESSVMRGLGFAPFGRWEMVLPQTAPTPVPPDLPSAEVRDVRPTDVDALARLHERAYERHLDRYLAMEDPDPTRDADLQLRDYFSGRYGELLSPGSSLVSLAGRTVAAAISVRRPGNALIVDVMTDPDVQGRGYGRTALVHAIRTLRDRGESAIILNVTDGNRSAVRLYSAVGFVPSMGPTKEWYDARRMPVETPPTPRD